MGSIYFDGSTTPGSRAKTSCLPRCGKTLRLYVRKGDKNWGFVNVKDHDIGTVTADVNENDGALRSSYSRGST